MYQIALTVAYTNNTPRIHLYNHNVLNSIYIYNGYEENFYAVR